VLDGVFNHASRGFFQFHDILENGPHSPWLDWFQIDNWPLSPYDGRHPANYIGWANNRALPKFNTNNAAVREFLMQVGEYWVREFDIDGWRLDVPTEIKTPGFWEEFRARTRAVKPDLYLVGEIWRAAPDWVRGDRFDATMNYLFAAATIAFTAGRRVSQKLVADRSYDPYPGIDAVAFDERIRQLLQLYDWDTQLAQLNLLDSHDAPRILSVARGDKDTLRLATLFQMTFPGAPCVYYGDEIALRGTKRYDRPHRDQDARWPFPWHDEPAWDHDMLDFFRKIIALRHKHRVLRRGHFTPLCAVGQAFGFLRGDNQEKLVVLLNCADEPATLNAPVAAHFADETPLRCLFGSGGDTRINQGHLRLELPPRTGCVLAVASQ
jgi:glycosidase